MAGVAFRIDRSELEAAIRALEPLVGFDGLALMEAAGSLGESQTRRRIEEEKTAPDGTPWAPNQEGTSILLATGEHLRDTIAFRASSDEAEWGSSWEHASVHQEGAVIRAKNAERLAFTSGGRFARPKQVTVPARPFIGLSDDNRRELEELVTDHFGGLLR